ncbi:MAG: ubiquitin-like domain-containing protein [Acutalibacteraceae bacterium]|jgi:uncharacterized protein YabE (DUF348 family)/3D (Asp-Asp-Asp) domain-containing protein
MSDSNSNGDAGPELRRAHVVIGVISFVLIISLTMVVASALASYKVTINDGISTQTVNTFKDTPEEVLEQQGITLGENDFLDTSAFVKGEDSTLNVYRACSVRINDGDLSEIFVGVKDVEKTLALNGITLNPKDQFEPALDQLVSEGLNIFIHRAFGVTVEADGEKTELETAVGTVKDALKMAGVTLGEDDETKPPAEEKLTPGMVVKVLRVTYKEHTERETVPFEKVTKKTSEMYRGEKKVIQKGVKGKNEVVYKDRIVNGVFESAEVISTKVLEKPVQQITLVGTLRKITIRSGSKPISPLPVPADIKLGPDGLPTNYTRIVDGTATAYSGGGGTASGRPAQTGYIAVNPKQFPYGTRLFVVTLDGQYVYGYCIAADTGGFAKRNSCTIDVYLDTFDDCYVWGRRGVRIYVLD